MGQLEQIMGRLRLLLSDVAQRKQTAEGLKTQFQRQMDKVTGIGSYGQVELDQLLTVMADLESKMAELDRSLRHLSLIEKKAKAELESLELTKMVEDARVELDTLQHQSTLDSGQQERIKALHRIISEASEAAGRRIAGEHS